MEKIADNIWKINVDSNVYFLDIGRKIVIDTGPREAGEAIKRELGKLVDLSKVDAVIFTHLHYDHVGNFDIFPNAKFYASEEEVESYRRNKLHAVLHPAIASKFNIELRPLTDLEGFDIIKTPGHTKGSFCLFYKKEKILFSGDTLFFNGYGRVDFPGAVPEKMEGSLEKLKKIDYKILAPGHDY
ncbi:MBL fold metallo-hydrolase [Candidatus Woesearchaeota archaeon]|nr:MBL fold metallo-hydrolase [Candidatus Woesearchaeota archaeon]